MKTQQCRSCGDPVIWAVTKAGKRIPVDPDVSETGNIALRRGTRGQIVAVVSRTPVNQGRLSHFVTCPNAQKHRKTEENERTGTRCPDCQLPILRAQVTPTRTIDLEPAVVGGGKWEVLEANDGTVHACYHRVGAGPSKGYAAHDCAGRKRK